MPNPLELNTAANGVNNTFSVGALDLNWYAAVGNATGPTSAFVPARVVGNCAPDYWYNSPFSNANWIAYDFGAGCNHDPQGCVDLYFRRQIILPGTNGCGQPISENFCLAMDFFADNSVYEIKVNSTSNYLFSLPDDPYNYIGYQNITTVNLCNGWHVGLNSIVVHIKSCPFAAGFLAQANIGLVNTYFYPLAISQSICEGTQLFGYTASGTYVDTLQAGNNCDTIRTLNLTVLPASTSSRTVNICADEAPFEGHFTSGVYVETYPLANGCDSTSILNLTVFPASATNLTVNICENETPYQGYTTSGIYTDFYQSVHGCDSTRVLNLTVSPTEVANLTLSVCDHETPYNGHTTSGNYTDTFQSANGCDSIVALQLTVNPDYLTSESISICPGTNYDFNGQIVSGEGIYSDTLLTASGCDSVFVLNLEVFNNVFLGNDTFLCAGNDFRIISPSENTTWFDNTIGKTKLVDKTGAYWAKIIDANGCEIMDTVFIQFNTKIFIPNVFSPNGDGINDFFFPQFSEPVANFKQFKFRIFNRWGSLIYSTNNPLDSGWNGKYRSKDCNTDVYVYLLDLETEFCKNPVVKGEVVLMK